jgi:hypothetical protein
MVRVKAIGDHAEVYCGSADNGTTVTLDPEETQSLCQQLIDLRDRRKLDSTLKGRKPPEGWQADIGAPGLEELDWMRGES